MEITNEVLDQLVENCFNFTPEIIRFMMKNNFNLNKTYKHNSPLTKMIKDHNLVMITELINYGYDVDEDQSKNIFHAIKNSPKPILEELIKHSKNINTIFKKYSFENNLLFDGIKSGDIDIIKLFIKYGADVNLKDEDGLSPLHYTIRYTTGKTCLAIIDLLVSSGADINSTTNNNLDIWDISNKYKYFETHIKRHYPNFFADKETREIAKLYNM